MRHTTPAGVGIAALIGLLVLAFAPVRASAATVEGPSPFVANYAATLREPVARADGIQHVDTPRMIRQLKALHVTAYFYLVWYTPTEWDDFVDEFLPAAQAAGIDVYVYLVPASECRPICSEPYGTDFVAWGTAIANLSLRFSAIKGWVIDDFGANQGTLTPQYVHQFVSAARAINPALRFYPLAYEADLSNAAFLASYAPEVDGFVFAFRDDPWHDTQVTTSLRPQLDHALAALAPYQRSLVLMLYASNLSRTPMPPSAQYVTDGLRTGLSYLRDGKLAGVVSYVLRMDGAQESPADFDHVHAGDGRLSLWSASSVAGAQGGAAQTVVVDPGAAAHRLTFWVDDNIDRLPRAGAMALQAQLDGTIVWQQDVTATPVFPAWQQVDVDVSSAVAGRTSATLSIRLVDRTNAPSMIVDAGVDDVAGQGVSVPDGGFEAPGWQLSSTAPNVVPAIDLFDPDRPAHVFTAGADQIGPTALLLRVDALPLPASVTRPLQIAAQGVLDEFLAGRYLAAAGRAQALSAQSREAGLPVLADAAAAVANDLRAEGGAPPLTDGGS